MDTCEHIPGVCCGVHAKLADHCDKHDLLEEWKKERASGDSWAVLISGEHWRVTTGERSLGHHCSLPHLGRAYAQIIDHFGRDRVIVIAQLSDVLRSLQKCADTGLPLWTKDLPLHQSKSNWASLLNHMNDCCGRLIADGGPDYDLDDVNPETVLRVLTGNPRKPGDKVLPQSGCKSVLISAYSHGWSHRVTNDKQFYEAKTSTIKCDLCGEFHIPGVKLDHSHSSILTREWFFEMPYCARDKSIYDAVSHTHVRHPYSLLYWQQLFQAYHKISSRDPLLPIVVLYQFCGSAGSIKFYEKPLYHQWYRIKSWPLYMMSSSGELEGAIPGLYQLWFKTLHQVLKENDKTVTLHDLYNMVEEKYFEENAELKFQSVKISNGCLICREFQGQIKYLNLCSVCFKTYDTSPEDERPDLELLKLQIAEEEAKEMDDLEEEIKNQRFSVAYGELSNIQLASVVDLFSNTLNKKANI